MTDFENRLLEVLTRIANTLDETHDIMIDVLEHLGGNEADEEETAEPEGEN